MNDILVFYVVSFFKDYYNLFIYILMVSRSVLVYFNRVYIRFSPLLCIQITNRQKVDRYLYIEIDSRNVLGL